MAFSLQEMEAWLPPELFSKDDIPSENAKLCFPPDFPFNIPSKNAIFAPEEHYCEGFDEDDYSFLLGLGSRPIRSTLTDDYPLQVKEKQGGAVSPVSTLYGTNGLWLSSTNGSPKSGSSPTEIKSNAREIFLAAADQVARLKLGYPSSMATNRHHHCSQYLCCLTRHNQTPRRFCSPPTFNETYHSIESTRPYFMPPLHSHVPTRTFRNFTPSIRLNSTPTLLKRERSGTGVFLPRQYGGVSATLINEPRSLESDLKAVRRIVPRSHCDGRQYELAGQQMMPLRSEKSNEIRLPQEWSY